MSDTPKEADLKRARDCANWVKNCGGVLAAGGGGMFLTLVLGQLDVTVGSYIALVLVYGLTLSACNVLAVCGARRAGIRFPVSQIVNRLIPGVGIMVIGLATAIDSQSAEAFTASTSRWWFLVALTLVVGFLGLRHRRSAEGFLEDSA